MDEPSSPKPPTLNWAIAIKIAVLLGVVVGLLLLYEARADCQEKRDRGYQFFLFPPTGCVQIDE